MGSFGGAYWAAASSVSNSITTKVTHLAGANRMFFSLAQTFPVGRGRAGDGRLAAQKMADTVNPKVRGLNVDPR
jgi:hypothetical protein